MKKLCFLLLVLSSAAFAPATAQIDMPADSIAPILCKVWTVNYALMGGAKIGMQPGARAMDLEFKKDKTLNMSSGSGNPKTKGTWAYDATSKTIKVTVNGQSRMTVIRLQADQLTISVDTKDATPDDPMEIKMVYKVKGT